VHRVLLDDIKYPLVFVRSRLQRPQSNRRIVEHVFYLAVTRHHQRGFNKEASLTVMSVPSLPAHGFGSADWPGLGGAKTPSM
jgi:hypothetical protein